MLLEIETAVFAVNSGSMKRRMEVEETGSGRSWRGKLVYIVAEIQDRRFSKKDSGRKAPEWISRTKDSGQNLSWWRSVTSRPDVGGSKL